jgi:uncharacterized protein
VGVHQDGLVHVSQLAHKFVEDAHDIVKAGDIVKVKVLEVDVARKRISLSMRLDAAPAQRQGVRENRYESAGRAQRTGARAMEASAPNAMASAFAKWQSTQK